MFQFSCGGLLFYSYLSRTAIKTHSTLLLVHLFTLALPFFSSANWTVGFLFSHFYLVKGRMDSTVSVIKLLRGHFSPVIR